MHNLAIDYLAEASFEHVEHGKVMQEKGIVSQTTGETYVVQTASGLYNAQRAVSCLVEPVVGDVVLCCLSEEDCYVLAVLRRQKNDQKTRLMIDGDAELKVQAGSLSVSADDGLSLASKQTITTASQKLSLRAVDSEVVSESLSILASILRSEVRQMKVVGTYLDAVVERVSEKFKRSYRIIEEFDLLRAKQVDYSASENVRIRAENTLVTAKRLVKLDGEQIHVG